MSTRPLDISELINEQQTRWAAGDCPGVEQLVAEFQSVELTDDALVDLIYNEVVLREAHGEVADEGEYCQRFPSLADAIVRQFQIHRAFKIQTPETDEQHRDPTIDDACDVSRSAGIRIPGYQLDQIAGRGGSGVAWRATDTRLGRTVAIKILTGDKLDQTVRARLVSEATACASLTHPAIVDVYHVGESDGVLFLVMEFLPGGSLAERLSSGSFTIEQTVQIVKTVAEAVHYAHEHGVIHRDLKPGNILMDDTGDPHVCDFGLARQLDAEHSIHATGDILGTPAYMSPEQARGETVDARSDVYSLGAILYEMLCGRTPFHAASTFDVLNQVVNTDPAAPRQLNPFISQDLETICLHAIEKSPARRYQTAAELANELERFASGEPIHARPITVFGRLTRWCKREPRLAVLSAAAALLAIGLTVVATIAFIRIGEATSETQAQRLEAVKAKVRAVLNASPSAVSFGIESLDSNDSTTIRLLQDHAYDETADPGIRLNAACALAAMNDESGAEDCSQIILDCLQEVPLNHGTCRNVVDALSIIGHSAIPSLQQKASEGPLDSQLRYSTIALFLGHPQAAEELVKLAPDPEARTRFIHEFADWSGEESRIHRLLERSEGKTTPLSDELTTALCLAIGNMDPLTFRRESRKDVIRSLQLLYQTSPNAAVHSAADWSLRQWAETPFVTAASKNADWSRNSVGLTLVRIPAAKFTMGNDIHEISSHVVQITRDYLISDREVCVRQFQECRAESAEVAAACRYSPDTTISPTEDCPVQSVSWEAAILFCNWLSKKEDRTQCYTKVATEEQVSQWTCDFTANGYRLPTEAEWEYAARAVSRTKHSFGGGPELVHQYLRNSNLEKVAAFPGGTLIPNGFGLFDMEGNVWEWCWDQPAEIGSQLAVDPTGPTSSPKPDEQIGRVHRGGGVDNSSGDSNITARGQMNETGAAWNVGFRVAVTAE